MKHKRITPNLVVRDVAAIVEFYRSVLGFQPAIKVPEQPPYVFGSVISGDVEIFFNEVNSVREDFPELVSRPIGGTMTLFLEVEGIEEALKRVQDAKAKIVMPLKTQFYGMREFAFEDPEGWVITIAEKVK